MDAKVREIIERLQALGDNPHLHQTAQVCTGCIDNFSQQAGNNMFRRFIIDLLERSDPDGWTDEQLGEYGLVRLPRDKDGVPVNVGDTVREDEDGHTFRVDGFELIRGEWFAYEYYGIRAPVSLCHRLSPVTVESVLREFARESSGINMLGELDVLVAEYAKRFELKDIGGE